MNNDPIGAHKSARLGRRSAGGLTQAILSAAGSNGPRDASSHSSSANPTRRRRIAIFAIHGISPIQRYGFQDQIALGFRGFLQASTQTVWSATVTWPKAGRPSPELSISSVPSVIRLQREPKACDDRSLLNPAEPRPQLDSDGAADDKRPPGPLAEATFDIFEGYWSPLSKGRTNIASLLAWLMKCTFAASSSTASLPCTVRKLLWDFGYIASVIIFAGILGISAVLLGIFSLVQLEVQTASAGIEWSWFSHPIDLVLQFSWEIKLALCIDIVAAYLIVQIIILGISEIKSRRNAGELKENDSDRFTRRFDQTVIKASRWHIAAGCVLLVPLAVLMGVERFALGLSSTTLTALAMLSIAYLFLRIGLWLLDFVVEDVLGDIRVYSDHDTTSSNYAVRSAIIETVSNSLERVLTVAEPYDAIHVVAHSLGSTIGLDVLLRVRQAVERDESLEKQWNAIRSFTTFGSALEKTKFFFDVRNPTLSAAQDQWAPDVYGPFFSASEEDSASSNQVVFWQNFLYCRDVVANQLRTFISDVAPGGQIGALGPRTDDRSVATNTVLKSKALFYRFVHGDYLSDPNFLLKMGSSILRLSGDPPDRGIAVLPGQDNSISWC